MNDYAPKLQGRHVYIRPTSPDDYEFLFNIEILASTATRWRFRGSTPSFQQFVRLVQEDVLVSFVVAESENNRPLGSVLAHSADFRNGLASIAAVAAPEAMHSGRLIEGVCLLVDYVFQCWNLRKVYLQTFDFNLGQFKGLRDIVIEEARLRDYEYFAGRYWDKVYLSIGRATWERVRSLVLDVPVARHRNPLDFEHLVRELETDLDWTFPRDPTAELQQDCALDSLTMFALLTMLEDYSGVVMPNGVRNNLLTLGDAYHWYENSFEASLRDPSIRHTTT